ncbi:zinc-dependent metalloprotease family protein [Arthrobacter sp. UYCu712]|uniref:zinc-dependent metalloprotease family protein n=1 Tax=Arthrobacter sp. UYCu712 TaxID=3156340 RepID=UPI003399E112
MALVAVLSMATIGAGVASAAPLSNDPAPVPPPVSDLIPTPPVAPGTARPRAEFAGQIGVTVVSVQLADKSVKDVQSISLDAARKSVSAASGYWSSTSNNKISMNVARTIEGFKSSARSTDSFEVMMGTISRELKWSYDANTVLVAFVPHPDLNYQGSGGIQGGGWSSGNGSGRILMPMPGGLTNSVVSHEFGHVFGLMHANSLQCTNGKADVSRTTRQTWADRACTSREYGDSTDIMGVSQYAQPALNAALFDFGGFGRGDEIRNLGTVKGKNSFTLNAWGGKEAKRALKFTDPTTGEVYYVQVRLPVGYDAATAASGNKGLEFLKADLGSGGAASVLIPPSTLPFLGWYNKNHAWQAGSTFTTDGGVQISVNWVSQATANVTVTEPPSSTVQIRAAAARHPELGAATSGIIKGLKDGGAYQMYQEGAVIWSPKTGAHASQGLRGVWQKYGVENGRLGYPLTDEYSTGGGGVTQDYQGGAITWAPGAGAHALLASMADKHRSFGGASGTLGYPLTEEIKSRDNGTYQEFQRGVIHWSPATGARVSQGDIRWAWGATGYEYGNLGYPASDASCGRLAGGCLQWYQRGSIMWSPQSGARVLTGGIAGTWYGMGAEGSILGYPTSNEAGGLKNGGVYQMFQNGAIIWSPTTGSWASTGPIRNAWAKSGLENGRLGYPVSNEYPIGSGATEQQFQGGSIKWLPWWNDVSISYK